MFRLSYSCRQKGRPFSTASIVAVSLASVSFAAAALAAFGGSQFVIDHQAVLRTTSMFVAASSFVTGLVIAFKSDWTRRRGELLAVLSVAVAAVAFLLSFATGH